MFDCECLFYHLCLRSLKSQASNVKCSVYVVILYQNQCMMTTGCYWPWWNWIQMLMFLKNVCTVYKYLMSIFLVWINYLLQALSVVILISWCLSLLVKIRTRLEVYFLSRKYEAICAVLCVVCLSVCAKNSVAHPCRCLLSNERVQWLSVVVMC